MKRHRDSRKAVNLKPPQSGFTDAEKAWLVVTIVAAALVGMMLFEHAIRA